MAVLLIVVVIFLVLLVGLLLAFLFSRADHAVTNTRTAMTAEEKAYNPNVTLGHKIKVQADYEDQLKQARKVAATRAAAPCSSPLKLRARTNSWVNVINRCSSIVVAHDTRLTSDCESCNL